MLPRVRPLSADARRIQLRRAGSFEAARLAARAAKAAPEPGAPTPVDDEPKTMPIPRGETMSEMPRWRDNMKEAA